MLTPEQITALVEAIRDGTYTIEDAFEDIATGQYGEDVRKAMYAGLLACYHDGKAGAADAYARQEIASLRAEVAAISTLEEGSTTGDAELIAARTDYSGKTWANLKAAIVGAYQHDMRFVVINATNVGDYGGTCDNFPMQSIVYANSSWCEDLPATGLFWLRTYAGSTTTDRYAMQTAYHVSDGKRYIRIKPYNTAWGPWKTTPAEDPANLTDYAGHIWTSLGDAIREPYKHDMRFVVVNAALMESDYDSLLGNLPMQSICYVHGDWATDYAVPGIQWVITYAGSTGDNRYAMQIAYLVSNGRKYVRTKPAYEDWKPWQASDGHAIDGIYMAFGDSTTYGQVAVTGNRSVNNYPAVVGRALNMTVNNQGVKGQGLLENWDTIMSTVSSIDYTGVKLITVGWAYNDTQQYQNYPLGSYTDDWDSETIIGKYFTIMDEIQSHAPTATVILVTGYGIKGDFQFAINCADGDHTYKEFYDELEKMCNFRGWCCVNQSKGCWVNFRTSDELIGDNVHPTEDGYKVYGNYIAARIASLFANIKMEET